MKGGFVVFFLSIVGFNNNFWYENYWIDLWKLLFELSRDRGGREREELRDRRKYNLNVIFVDKFEFFKNKSFNCNYGIY